MSTPFAQLEKRAYWGDPQVPKYTPQTGYKYQQGSTGLNNPYAPATTLKKQPGTAAQLGMMGAEIGADVALGSNAITGVPWFLGKTLYHGLKGNWGQALTNFGMGALSIIPGAASAAAGAKGALGAGRIATTVARGANALQQTGRAGQAVVNAGKTYARGINAAQQVAGRGVAAMKALPAAQATGQAMSRGIGAAKNFATQPGVLQGARTGMWNTGARVANSGFARSTAKFAPISAAGGMLPNNELQNPTQPPPPPMQNNGGLLDFMSEAMVSGGVPR